MNSFRTLCLEPGIVRRILRHDRSSHTRLAICLLLTGDRAVRTCLARPESRLALAFVADTKIRRFPTHTVRMLANLERLHFHSVNGGSFQQWCVEPHDVLPRLLRISVTGLRTFAAGIGVVLFLLVRRSRHLPALEALHVDLEGMPLLPSRDVPALDASRAQIGALLAAATPLRYFHMPGFARLNAPQYAMLALCPPSLTEMTCICATTLAIDLAWARHLPRSLTRLTICMDHHIGPSPDEAAAAASPSKPQQSFFLEEPLQYLRNPAPQQPNTPEERRALSAAIVHAMPAGLKRIYTPPPNNRTLRSSSECIVWATHLFDAVPAFISLFGNMPFRRWSARSAERRDAVFARAAPTPHARPRNSCRCAPCPTLSPDGTSALPRCPSPSHDSPRAWRLTRMRASWPTASARCRTCNTFPARPRGPTRRLSYCSTIAAPRQTFTRRRTFTRR